MIFKKNNIDLPVLTNLVFSFFPLSFILGNLIINLNIVLFCCLGIIQLKSQILKNKFNFPLKIIFLLFLLVFLSTCISFIKSLYFDGYEYSHLVTLIKSVTYFRFFLFLIIVYFLSKLDLLNFRYFFISAAFFAIIISLDVIYQHIFGFNIIGVKSMNERHSTGFFGDELIAGGFIKNFSFFTILFFAYIFRSKRNSRFILTTIIICILGAGIIVSGNRMSLVLFLFGLFLIFLFHKKFRIIVFASFICLFLLFKFIISTSQQMQWHYGSFFSSSHNESILYNAKDVLNSVGEIAKKNLKQNYKIEKETRTERRKLEHNHHARIFLTALATWKVNKLFGNGIKSFRKDCSTIISTGGLPIITDIVTGTTKSDEFIFICSNHPHNYYLEILTETGIVGFLTTVLIGLIFIIFIFNNFKFLIGSNIQNFFLLACSLSLLMEVFPIRSSGSIFTTNNAAYLVLIASIILSYKSLYNEKNIV